MLYRDGSKSVVIAIHALLERCQLALAAAAVASSCSSGCKLLPLLVITTAALLLLLLHSCWRSQGAPQRNGGYFSESPLAGRRLM
jgi:hypothetical protein